MAPCAEQVMQYFHVDELRLAMAAVTHGILNRARKSVWAALSASERPVFFVLCPEVLISLDGVLTKAL